MKSPMCKSKKTIDAIPPPPPRISSASASAADLSSSSSTVNFTTSSSSYSSKSSSASLAGLKASLPENPNLYDISEISAATGGFLRRRLTSTSWQCSLRGRDAVVFQRKLRRPSSAKETLHRLAAVSRSHHSSLVPLLGAALSGNFVYLAYESVPGGVTLAECLRNTRNPSFTVLPTWISRMKVAADLAHGLDYVHRRSGLKDSTSIHNHIDSSAVAVVVDEDAAVKAKLWHFGTAEIASEAEGGSGAVEGTRGYMSPELRRLGLPSRESDVYAFGVVVLELISGKEALKYCDGGGGVWRSVSVVESARKAVERGEVRRWVDGRLGDSFPVEVAEQMVRVGLDCAEEDPKRRPDMGRVAVLVSKLYLESEIWADGIKVPTDISVSFAPR